LIFRRGHFDYLKFKHIDIEHIVSGFKLSHKIISKPEK